MSIARGSKPLEVLIVGAGPVGLLAALRLAEKGVAVEIVDQSWRPSVHSYALALHPESLRLLHELGLADRLFREGRRIERLAIHRGSEPLATLDYRSLRTSYPALLVLPQSRLEAILEEALRERKVRVHWNHKLTEYVERDGAVIARIARLDKVSMGYPIARTEWVVADSYEVQTRFLVGADGYQSTVRHRLGGTLQQAGESERFAVFEFTSKTELEPVARLVIHPVGGDVLWPMQECRARWSFAIRPRRPEEERPPFDELVREHAPWFTTQPDEIYWTAQVVFDRAVSDLWGRGSVWLAGDAAHSTSPLGTQSMNVGLQEAWDLAGRLHQILREGAPRALLEDYGTRWHQLWLGLLGLDGGPAVKDGAPEWAAAIRHRLVSWIPASGRDLEVFLAQLGLEASFPTPARRSPSTS